MNKNGNLLRRKLWGDAHVVIVIDIGCIVGIVNIMKPKLKKYILYIIVNKRRILRGVIMKKGIVNSKVDCKTCIKNGKCKAQVNGGTCHYMPKGNI